MLECAHIFLILLFPPIILQVCLTFGLAVSKQIDDALERDSYAAIVASCVWVKQLKVHVEHEFPRSLLSVLSLLS